MKNVATKWFLSWRTPSDDGLLEGTARGEPESPGEEKENEKWLRVYST